MTKRNGTYVAFHAGNTTNPTASDIRYYRMLLAWHKNDGHEFRIINSHDKTNAVRDTSQKETLRRAIVQRLNLSKNLLLIVSDETKKDTDWVPYEIEYAVDNCNIPLIVAYVERDIVQAPKSFSHLWPNALLRRINNGAAKAIHIPFKQQPINSAIKTYSRNNLPKGSLTYYTKDAYRKWGLVSNF